MIKLKDILSEGKKIKVGQRFNANGITWEVIKVGPTSSRAKAITKNKQFDPHKIFDNKIIIKQIESVNEIDTLGTSGLKSFAKKHKYSIKSKRSGGRVSLIYLSKDGKRFGPFDPTVLTKKYLLKKLGLGESTNEEVDKYGNVHAKTKKELKAAIAKAINIILKGKTPKFDIINGWSGEMISWKDGNDYVWQPNAIPYAERELK